MFKLPYRRIIGVLSAVLMVFSLVSLEILDVFAITPTYTVSSDYKKSKYYSNLSTLTLTGNQRSDVVRVALTQLGYHEGNSERDFAGDNAKGNRNFTEYNRYHGKLDNNEGNGYSYGYYWCAAFATWCAVQAGIPEAIVPTESYVGVSTQRLRSWFLNNAKYYTRGNYTPITGDYIFFKDAGAAVPTTHVGLVLYVKGNSVYTIEGNAGGLDCVAIREYTLSNTYIVGYGVPNYKSGTTVSLDLTNRTNPGQYVITASSLALRAGPGTTYTALGALPQSAIVQITEINGNWGRLTYDGVTGWASLSYAMPLSMPDITITYDANGGTGAPDAQGKTADVPVQLSSRIPTRSGYRFLGWSTSPTASKALYAAGGLYTSNTGVRLYAVWELESYVIQFVDYDGRTLQSKTYHYGNTVTPPAAPTRPSDRAYHYEFSGWDKAVTPAASATVYTAQYATRPVEYSIVFCDDDGRVLQSSTYHYNDTPKAPDIPKKESDQVYSYTFVSWGEPIARVTGDKVYTAVYSKTYLEYLVTFSDENGIILSQQMYHYGDTVTPPEPPTKKSDESYDYLFLGWDKAVSEVHGVAFYTATYEKRAREYTVTFQNLDGSVLSQNAYHYGDTVTLPADPTMATDEKYIYAFTGWSVDGETPGAIMPVTGETVYTAVYEKTPLSYTVVFRDEAGKIYASDTYHYGDTLRVPADPQRAPDDSFTYRFDGWSEDLPETVTGDAVYVANFIAERREDGKRPNLPHILSPGTDEGSIPVLGIAILAVSIIAISALLIRLINRRRG